MAQVAVIALFHETNTFSPVPTDVTAFEAEGWYDGDALLHRYQGTKTVVGGFLDGLAERAHVPVGVFGVYATPAGRVTAQAWSVLTERVLAGLARLVRFDAILFELHGAMVVEGCDDPEAEICAAVRDIAGDRPVVAVTDYHANMTPQLLATVDLLVGYRTNPHIDTWETGRDAARHLDAMLAGGPRPSVVFGTVPVIAPAIAQGTSAWPSVRWLLRARELERRGDLLDVTVHGGYAYADVGYAGMGVTASTLGPVTQARAAVEELCELAWSMRADLRPQLPAPVEAIAAAVDRRHGVGVGPVGVADTGDNINGGTSGDGLALVAAVREHASQRYLTTWVHPGLLQAAVAGGAGTTVSVPAELAEATGHERAEVLAVIDGEFVNQGPMASGKRVSMGRSATLRIGNVDLLLQGRATQPNDPQMFRSAGLRPEDYDLVLLKGAAALRAGWAGVVRDLVDAATPGVSDSRLERLPYRNLAEQVWPLADNPARPMSVVEVHRR